MQEKKSDAAFSFLAPSLSKGEALYLIAEKKREGGKREGCREICVPIPPLLGGERPRKQPQKEMRTEMGGKMEGVGVFSFSIKY
jgi:hypothetical protein